MYLSFLALSLSFFLLATNILFLILVSEELKDGYFIRTLFWLTGLGGYLLGIKDEYRHISHVKPD